MSKSVRNTLILIVVLFLIIALIGVYYYYYKPEPISADAINKVNVNDTNNGLDNILNSILDENIETNTVQNTEKEEKNEEINNNTTINNNPNNTATENEKVDNNVEEDNSLTTKENKAINLVKDEWKKEWGNLDDVSFNVSVQSDGKYGVTVYDTTTTQSIQFYIVDVDNGIVKEK